MYYLLLVSDSQVFLQCTIYPVYVLSMNEVLHQICNEQILENQN